MGEKIVVGPINKGLKTDRTAFNIDNDSFPTLENAYQWRGRIKRKRGTSLLGRLRRYIGTTDGAGNLVETILPVPITSGISSFTVGSNVFTDPGGASPVVLTTSGPGTATLDRTTGQLTIVGSNAATDVVFYPTLPVMGLEDFVADTGNFPINIGFDTRYAYNISTTQPYPITDVSFYKNPEADATLLPNYTPKTTWTRLNWDGLDYQQFWTTNYQGALWATNGVQVPFDGASSTIGMQFNSITNITVVDPGPYVLAPPNPAGQIQITFSTAHGLSVGDFLFINEVQGLTGVNGQSGYIPGLGIVSPVTVNLIIPYATIAGAYTAKTGIAQYLTNNSDTSKDGIRWYDGSPTDGNIPPVYVEGKGWVNFAPPLSQNAFSIADLPSATYYLVGARMIVPFKDRLVFIGPVVQSFNDARPATINTPIYLPDTIVYSQNGTPFYNASFTGDPVSSDTDFSPILTPVSQTATASAYFEDQTGFGGFNQLGINEPINTCSSNEDVLILGLRTNQVRMVYTGNDISPFNFFVINSELGSSSTFSTINMDQGVLTRGSRGYIMTSQVAAQRIDLEIPDQVFEINLQNNGTERITAERDFINEWVYFSYNSNTRSYRYPNQTLQFNYRDNSYGIFNESYTTYGILRRRSGLTWATVGTVFPTWSSWNVPWNAGSSTSLNPVVIAGNQQGFIVIRDQGTNEAKSLTIQNIDSASVVTSPQHNLNNGDYITISDALGTISTQVNDKIFQVTQTGTNTFTLNPLIDTPGDYLGGGLIKRMYIPKIISKQFPVAWDMARKTRLGPQQYLLTTTSNSQITLLIFLSQNGEDAYNNDELVPDPNSGNNSLVYSTVLYTCPEATNLGLTAANINLNMQTAINFGQSQIWHRMNTSLIGDTVQVGFTLSPTQMTTVNDDGSPISQFSEIEIHGFILDVQPSSLLA